MKLKVPLLFDVFVFSLSLIVSHPVLSFCLIQASTPLQVKYADGELERLGVI